MTLQQFINSYCPPGDQKGGKGKTIIIKKKEKGGDKKKQVPFENYAEKFTAIQSLLEGGKRIQSIRTDTVGSSGEIEILFGGKDRQCHEWACHNAMAQY